MKRLFIYLGLVAALVSSMVLYNSCGSSGSGSDTTTTTPSVTVTGSSPYAL